MWNNRIEENILYEDKEILVCRKPAGMPVQAAGIGTMDMESALKNYLAQKIPGKVPYLGIVHRLDQPVEGILVFAKTPGAAGSLSKQIMAGGAGKYYLAVVEGKPERSEGTLTDYLKKNGRATGSTGKYTWSKKSSSSLQNTGSERNQRKGENSSSNQTGDRKTSPDPGSAFTCGIPSSWRPKI